MWYLAILIEWAQILFALYLASLSYWFWPLSIFIIGTRQHSIGTLGHNAVHGQVVKSTKISDLLANTFCFWPLGFHSTGYKDFHFKHHKTLGTEDDPERLHLYNWSKEQWELPLTRKRIVKYAIEDLLGLHTPELFKAFKLIKRPTWVDWLSAVVYGSVSILLVYLFPFIICYHIAIFTSFWFAFRLRIWTEHVGSEWTHRPNPTWWQKWLFMPWGSEYHYEHHEHPSVPFNKLHNFRKYHGDSLSTIWKL